jgi:hypothetical protein
VLRSAVKRLPPFIIGYVGGRPFILRASSFLAPPAVVLVRVALLSLASAPARDLHRHGARDHAKQMGDGQGSALSLGGRRSHDFLLTSGATPSRMHATVSIAPFDRAAFDQIDGWVVRISAAESQWLGADAMPQIYR